MIEPTRFPRGTAVRRRTGIALRAIVAAGRGRAINSTFCTDAHGSGAPVIPPNSPAEPPATRFIWTKVVDLRAGDVISDRSYVIDMLYEAAHDSGPAPERTRKQKAKWLAAHGFLQAE